MSLPIQTTDRVVPPRRRVWASGFVFFVLALGLGWAFFQRDLAPWGDNATYIVLGRALAQGHGFREINHPDRPLHQKFPPGFPLMLAALQRWAPDDLQAMKLFVLLLFALSTVVVYRVVAGWEGEAIGLGVALLFCTNRLAVLFAHQVMSEMPYLFFSMLVFWVWKRREDASDRTEAYWAWVAFALALWALQVRMVGIALVGALIVALLRERRPWHALSLALATVVAIGALMLLRGSVGSSYAQALLLADHYDPAKGLLGPVEFVARLTGNLVQYGLVLLPDSVVPTGGNRWLALVVSALLFGGLGVQFWRQRLLPAAYFGFFFVLLLLWPAVWASDRMLVSLLPLILLLLVNGARAVLQAVPRLWDRLPGQLHLASGVLLVLPVALVNLLDASRHDPRADRALHSCGAAMSWVADHAPTSSVVLCRLPQLCHLLSGRRTVAPPRIRDAKEYYKRLDRDRVSHVVVDSLPLALPQAFLVSRIRSDPARFALAFQTAPPPTRIYTYRKPR